MSAASSIPERRPDDSAADRLVEVRGVVKHYPVKSGMFGRGGGLVHALDGVDLEIRRGEVLGLVGESGCGKSTLARQILRLERPTAGEILFEGRSILDLDRAELKALRRKMQIVFQDPYSSLNPRLTVGQIVAEPLIIHGLGDRRSRKQEVEKILAEVGLRPEAATRFPHEFSGGQRQRIGIARALILKPQLIVADEPISALDVSIQAQVLGLLKDLQRRYGLTYLFVAHDLAVVRYVSDRIAVMYLGKVVEVKAKRGFASPPLHPYTEALLSAAPTPDPTARTNRIVLTGDVPSPLNPPSGCRFHTRCPKAMTPLCAEKEPPLKDLGRGHLLACHLFSAA